MLSDEGRRLTRKRYWGQLPYDMHGVGGASIKDDIDMERFTREYLPSAVSPEVLKENERPEEEQMRALRMVDKDDTPTVTAILMLGKDPDYWSSGAYIQFVRYDGIEITDPIKSQQAIKGTLPD